MARSLLKITAIFFLTMQFLLAFCSPTVLAEINMEEDDVYVLDAPIPNPGHSISRGRSLATTVKKGAHCTSRRNICNGVTANKGKYFLFCCQKRCRNVLSDGNNCGVCGKKCRHGYRCCNGNGKCFNILSNGRNCGECGKRCPSGVRCSVGLCGYARG